MVRNNDYESGWTEELIYKIFGDLDTKQKYQKLYLIPNPIIPNKKII